MGGLTREAIIAAPAQRVFDFVADPHNAPRFISSITRILSGPQGMPKQGETWQAEANFLGHRSTLTLRLASLETSGVVRFNLEGEPQATLTLRLSLRNNNDATAVSLHLDVPSVPDIFLNALMGGLFTSDLARLKSILETVSKT